MGNKPKNQHTITQAYLDGFADEAITTRGSKYYVTWLYDKKTKKYHRVRTDQIMKEVHFYSVKDGYGNFEYKLENFLANQVEEPYKKIISTIRNDFTKLLDPQTGERLMLFLSYLPCRTTKFARVQDEVTKSILSNGLETFKKKTVKSTKKILLREKNINVSFEDLEKDAEEIFRKQLVEKDPKVSRIEALHRHQQFWMSNFMSRSWILLDIPEHSHLITSDNPMNVYAKPSSPDFNDKILLVALSKDLLFVFGRKGNEIKRRELTNPKDIDELNDYIAKTAERYVISNNLELLQRIILRSSL